MQNMKLCVSQNEDKTISTCIITYNMFPTMGTMKKVGSCKIKGLPQMQQVTPQAKSDPT